MNLGGVAYRRDLWRFVDWLRFDWQDLCQDLKSYQAISVHVSGVYKSHHCAAQACSQSDLNRVSQRVGFLSGSYPKGQ